MTTTINSYEAACVALGKDPNVRPDFSMLPELQRNYFNELFELDTIVEAKNNEGLEKPWNGLSRKYWPVFTKDSSSGSGWAYYVYVFWYTITDAGARPFRSYEMMRETVDQFFEKYVHILNYLNQKK
ncbi:hypothetical protein [Flavobacterium sp.]|uniref:hypothetical protein n=1 Tax=Flavobacterium sp. TaxID=239 RepID=UPI00261A1C33|nr:hypothetical protein [Flavobacterium sp.]